MRGRGGRIRGRAMLSRPFDGLGVHPTAATGREGMPRPDTFRANGTPWRAAHAAPGVALAYHA